MIVIGADPHKSQHTLAAVEAATGELLDDLTVTAKPKGHAELLRWGRSLGPERLWAIEDCRHRIAVTQKRMHAPAQHYLARKQGERKTKREALRCLERQLVRTVLRLLRPPVTSDTTDPLAMTNLTKIRSRFRWRP